jgi:tetratricopeptide (TPR) repeat protein
MTINPSISDIPYASIDHQSAFGSDEAEVLFSMNTIFRIGQIESLGPNLYRIHLTLINNEDQEMQQLIQYLREEITIQDDPMFRFGQLTLRMQEWPKAKEIYQSKLNKAIDNRHTEAIAHSCHQLGFVHYHLNEFDTALKYLQQSLNVLQQRRKMYGSAIADTHSMIGQVLFEQKNDLQIALKNMQQALMIRLEQYNPEPQVKNERNA